MDWPDLVKALKPLGWRETYEGHGMWNSNPGDPRRIFGLFGGRAALVSRVGMGGGLPLFEGTFAEVVEYLKGGQSK